MDRNTKEIDYIKKVWEERDGPGKEERYVVSRQRSKKTGPLEILFIKESQNAFQ